MKSTIQGLKASVKNTAGKKILALLAFWALASAQYSFAQGTPNVQQAQLLNSYYKVKNALVSSDPSLAASAAGELVTAINATDKISLDENTRAALLKDAVFISQSKDVKKQREQFAALSNSMTELAKITRLSAGPVYQQYCPMKKASWLSSEKAIKNPYYGSAMLTCGTVKETF